MTDSVIEPTPTEGEPNRQELLERLWQGLTDLRNLERKYPARYKGTDESARLDSLIATIKENTAAELGDIEKKDLVIRLAETLQELRRYLQTHDLGFPKNVRELLNRETQMRLGLWSLYHVFHNVLDKPLPSEVFKVLEERSLNTVWDSFTDFRTRSIPATQIRGPLPIDNQTQEIYEQNLKEFMNDFLRFVWGEALGDPSHCLFLDLCIWDPFRLYSKDNWALTKSGINNLGEDVIEDFYRAPHNNTFSLLYRSLKKEVLVIAVPPDVSDKKQSRETKSGLERPYVHDAKIEDYIPQGSVEACNALRKQFEGVIRAHSHFRADRNIYIHYIPSLFYPKQSGTGIGGLILISKTTFQRSTLIRFQTILDSILSKIGVYHLFENFFDQAVRSAVSSVMARNMSHNIGSHVIPRATVEAVRRRIAELKVLSDAERQSVPAEKRSEIILDLVTVLKGNLDEYTQRKSDFLAEITTEPLMTSRPAFFYREIILPFVENTLLMDNLAANEGIQYIDSLRNRLKIRVRINGRELRAKYQCRRCVETGEPGAYGYPDSLPYSLNCTQHPDTRLELRAIENGEHDVEVELPGPLGEFALYSFMENDIRNSAKHNKEFISHDEDLIISIDISEPTNEDSLNFYTIKVWNNVVEPARQVKLSVNGESYSVLWEAISALADSEIIQPDGNLKRQAWGIAEMKICSVLLRGPRNFAQALSLKSSPEYTPPKPLEVLKEEIDGEARLVYQFRLMKSRKICAVLPRFAEAVAAGARSAEEQETKAQEVKERHKREGVWIFASMKELHDALDKGTDDGWSQKDDRLERDDPNLVNIASIASFRFAIFDCSETAPEEKQKILKKLLSDRQDAGEASLASLPRESSACVLPKLPFRVLALVGRGEAAGADIVAKCVVKIKENFDTAALAQMSAGELYQWAWRQWIGRWLDADQSAVVNVYLDQREDEEPTSKWVKYATAFNNDSGNVKLDVFGWRGDEVESLMDTKSGAECINILYDRHRQLSNKMGAQLKSPREWAYTLLEKHSPDFTTLFSPKFPLQETEPWTLPWEMAEAGLLKILVIDERAAEFSMNEPDDNATRKVLKKLITARCPGVGEPIIPIKWHLAWAANTYICTHFGYKQEPEELHNRVKGGEAGAPYLKMRVNDRGIDLRLSPTGRKEKRVKAEAVLIHQGVIDDCGSRHADFNQQAFLDRLRQEFAFVVVESGRGIPPTLSEKEKFLPFSRLQHSILGNVVGKFGLARILLSLARRVRD